MIRSEKFSNVLQRAGCKKDDIVLIHSDITSIKGGSWIDKCKNLNSLISSYFDINSTIIIPSFTYSFCKTGIFNSKTTQSEVGIFDEYIRNLKIFKRTDHPIFSFSCKGKYADLFLKNSNSSTGDGSVFEKLYAFDAKIIFLGCRFINSCTFLHFIEQKNTVPYRYSKNFFPKRKMKFPYYEYYVRTTEKYKFHEYEKNTKIEKDLIRKKILKKNKINNFEISICNTRNLYKFITKQIQVNPYYILDKKPDNI